MLAKLLGQAAPKSTALNASTQANMQALYDAAAALYHSAEWERAEQQADALLQLPGLLVSYEVATLNLKATLAARTHRLEQAAQLYQAILQRQPTHIDALSNLGLVLQKLNRHQEALAVLTQAIQHHPSHANAQLNLGLAYQSLGRHEEAQAAYQRTLSIEPMNVQALFNIAKMLQDAFDFEEASKAYQRVLDVDPSHADALANLIFVQHYRYPSNEAAQQELIRRCATLNLPQPEWPRQAVDKSPLRVGFVSADLRKHPVGYFLRDVLLALASSAVASGELTLFAYANHPQVDELTQDIQPVFASWHAVDLWNDARLEAQIRSDEIDILIDLSGRTAGNRLLVFAAKPAPVQVSWLGYFATTGLSQMDVVLADPVCVPESEESLYVEKVVRLPHTRLCMSRPMVASASMSPPVLKNGFITFGCFQTLPKINDGVLSAWAQILAACPQARLRLQAQQFSDAGQIARFSDRLCAAKIDSTRVDLLGPMSRDLYFASYNDVDILLDTFPYPGGTTTAEALWMGVPTLTLALPGMLGRQGQSMLENFGLHDWVTHSEADYINQGVIWGQGGVGVCETLSHLRRDASARAAKSPLFDAPKFADDWWAVMRSIWRSKMAVDV